MQCATRLHHSPVILVKTGVQGSEVSSLLQCKLFFEEAHRMSREPGQHGVRLRTGERICLAVYLGAYCAHSMFCHSLSAGIGWLNRYPW